MGGAALAFTEADFLAMEKELCARSFPEFVASAWHVLEPSTPLKWGWALDAVCDHLVAVHEGDILHLLVNVPPGTMKSLLTGVFFPAWEWGPRDRPELRYLGTAHSQPLAVRDNLKCRRLIQSPWYQERWPVALTGDQNAKTKFENDSTGFREAMAFGSLTGSRGDRIIIDDPHSVDDARSATILAADIETFREAVPSRVNNEESATIINMQRLHEGDVSAVALELGYDHLCIPMRYEGKKIISTCRGTKDPRKADGELMFPERFPEKQVAQLEKSLGAYATAGQLQQRPAPRGGGFFEWDKLRVVGTAPKCSKYVRYWDKAGTQGGGCRTAGVLMGITADGDYCVVDVVTGQWAAPQRERVIKQTADTDKAKYSSKVKVWIEQEPGSGGKESAESTIKNLAGHVVKAERPTGDKVVRAEPYAVQVEAGNVLIVAAPWNTDFIDEHKTFPMGKFKDQIDAASGAFNKLAGSGYRVNL